MLGFRVWDVENKQMVDMEYDNENSEWPMRLDHTGKLGYEPEHYIPMQSTGIECIMPSIKTIFEGDILKIDERKSLYLVTDVVEFLFYASKFGWRSRENKLFPLFEIVGNRYENPELLEKVKC